ncbi:MAG TPA: MBL fold metallo-hydrolase [Actinophytocola sp.]|uniref:MBL fold metallo-hydrolase n=1 Tax=Actinophytocola sp. TaxID=1872138 RepID=UPI002DBED719|nr:MBL fold metallo-hydrolase [Actinophytocola sp.]HEU5472845.1 MBL fold metallo-hydrolase [Actinophytocola sp.]
MPIAVRRSALLVPVGAAAALARAVWEVPASLGGQATGARLERMRQSPRFRDGVFHNEVPASIAPASSGPGILREMARDRVRRRPRSAVPLVVPSTSDLAAASAGGLRATWFGHASVLVELDGTRVLFDPVWSERVSPSQAVGPRRLHPMPVPLDVLPALDAVVISHDHYDHLDMRTIRSLAAAGPVPFVVPLGVGAHLERWGVPPARIVELDWEERATVGGVELVATAARHFSGRRRPGENSTLWASWVVAGRDRRVFYTGDSGFFDDYAKIGAGHGPFDLTLVQIGAYSPYWPDIHMTPEEGLATHLAVGGGVLVPVHWATFNLALHSWDEPVERLLAAAAAEGARVVVPRPGEPLDLDDLPRAEHWWRTVS